MAKLKWEQDMAVQQMKGLIVLFECLSDDGGDHGSTSNDSDDPPPVAHAYSCTGDWKGKGPGRKLATKTRRVHL